MAAYSFTLADSTGVVGFTEAPLLVVTDQVPSAWMSSRYVPSPLDFLGEVRGAMGTEFGVVLGPIPDAMTVAKMALPAGGARRGWQIYPSGRNR